MGLPKMTISSSTDQDIFPGNGVTTVFPLSYRFLDNADIVAVLINDATGVETPWTLGTNYTLAGAGEPEENGNPASVLTATVAPAVGYSLSVSRIMEVTQPTDIVNQGKFYQEIHENVFDRIVMLIQQVASGITRALQLNLSGTAWDAKNKQIKNLADGDDPQDAVSLQQMQIYVGEHGGGTDDVVSVRDFGAVGDGITDDQPAFEAALAFSDSVYVPPGRYLIGTGNLQVKEKRLWAMCGQSSGTWAARGTTGAVLVTTQTTNPVIDLKNGGVVEGLQFYYPDQDGSTITDISGYPTIVGAPITYPPAISCGPGAANWSILDCVFINAYDCMRIGDSTMVQGTGRGVISGCSAFVLKYFIRGFNLLDQVIIDNYTVSPGIITGDDPAKQKLYRWALQNGRFAQINKADGLIIGKGLVYGIDLCLNFVGTASPSLLKVSGLTLDGSRRFLDSVVTLSGAVFSDIQLLCNTIESAAELTVPAMRFAGPNAPLFGGIQMNNIQFHQGLGEVIKIEGTGAVISELTLTNFHFYGWGRGIGADANCPAIVVNANTTVISASEGYLRPANVNYIGFRAGGAGVGRMVLDNIEQDGGLRFAVISPATYVSVKNCRTVNTTPGTEDVTFSSVAEIYQSGNTFSVPPITKQSSAPHFHARQAGTQTLSTGATMQFTNEVLDQDASFNSGTGVHSPLKAGRYLYNVATGFDAGTLNDVWALQLVTTQRTYQAIFTVESATVDKPLSLNVVADMRVGDTAQVIVTRISGTGTFTTVSGGNGNWFTGTLMDSA